MQGVLATPTDPPSLAEARRSLKRYTDKRGDPYFLPTAAALDGEPNHPSGCRGPYRRDRHTRRKWPCNRETYCLYCWQRRRVKAALWAMMEMLGHKTIIGGSAGPYKLLRYEDDVESLRDDVYDFLEDHGFTKRVVNVHAYGSNPADGANPGVDWLAAGDDADTSWMQDKITFPPAKPWIQAPQGRFQPYHARLMSDKPQLHILRGLYNKGSYSGRETYDVPMLFAGRHRDGSGHHATLARNIRDPDHKVTVRKLDWQQWQDLQADADEWNRWFHAPRRTRRKRRGDEHRRQHVRPVVLDFSRSYVFLYGLRDVLGTRDEVQDALRIIR